MQAPILPYDVLENIVHCSPNDWSLLWLFIKTSKSFSSVCRRYIYYELQIRIPWSSDRYLDAENSQHPTNLKFYLLCHEFPHVHSYFRKLTVEFAPKKISESMANHDVDFLIAIMFRLSNLRCLEIKGLSATPSKEVMTTLRGILNIAPVQKLAVRYSSQVPITELLPVNAATTRLATFSLGPIFNVSIPQNVTSPSERSRISLTSLELVARRIDLSQPSQLGALYLEPQSPFDITKLQTLRIDARYTRSIENTRCIQSILNLARDHLRDLSLPCPLTYSPREPTPGCSYPSQPLDLSRLSSLRVLTLLVPKDDRIRPRGMDWGWVTNTIQTVAQVNTFTLTFSAHVVNPLQDVTKRFMPILLSLRASRLKKLNINCPNKSLELDWLVWVHDQEPTILEGIKVDVFVSFDPWCCVGEEVTTGLSIKI